AARVEIGALDELVLELADVCVLRLELHLFARAGGDGVDRLAGLIERVFLRTAAQLEHARERARDLRGRVAAGDVDRDAVRFRVAETRRLAAVVVLERDDDVGVLRLAHHGDRQIQAAGGLVETRPRDSERVHLHGLADVARRRAGRAAALDRVRGLARLARGGPRDLACAVALALLRRDRPPEEDG